MDEVAHAGGGLVSQALVADDRVRGAGGVRRFGAVVGGAAVGRVLA